MSAPIKRPIIVKLTFICSNLFLQKNEREKNSERFRNGRNFNFMLLILNCNQRKVLLHEEREEKNNFIFVHKNKTNNITSALNVKISSQKSKRNTCQFI